MLGYTTKNACLTRMNIIAITAGLTGRIDDILPCIKLPLSALGSEQYPATLADFHHQKSRYLPHRAVTLVLRTWI
jgi:hypothetical protein